MTTTEAPGCYSRWCAMLDTLHGRPAPALPILPGRVYCASDTEPGEAPKPVIASRESARQGGRVMAGFRVGATRPDKLCWADGDLVPRAPDLAGALAGTAISPAAFADWLVPLLAAVRLESAVRGTMGQPAAVVAWLRACAANVPAALADGRLRHLPSWIAEPTVWVEARKLGFEWPDILAYASAYGDCTLIEICLSRAADSVARLPSRRGRPSNSSVDALLHLVLGRLRAASLGADEAQERAAAVLHACRLPAPGAESVPRAARRGRERISVLAEAHAAEQTPRKRSGE